jgi:hypothetical protein
MVAVVGITVVAGITVEGDMALDSESASACIRLMGMQRQCAIPEGSMTSMACGTSIPVARFLTKPDGGPSPGGPLLHR